MTALRQLGTDLALMLAGIAFLCGMVVVILIGIAKLAAPALPHVGYGVVGMGIGVPVWWWSLVLGLL